MNLRHYLALTLALGMLAPLAQATELTGEHKLKAAYLLNFARYVRWPEEDEDRPLEFCAAVPEEFGAWLLGNLDGQFVRRRVVRVRVLGNEIPLQGSCDLHYESRHDSPPSDMGLTVGDGAEFVRNGGGLAFVSTGDRVGFVANAAALDAAGIDMDARLLAIAREVLQ